MVKNMNDMKGIQFLLPLPQTTRSAEASSMPLELLAMQV